jgi:hypothetical protein
MNIEECSLLRSSLSLVYLRDKQPQQAKAPLTDLGAEFPQNSLLARELERLGSTAQQ